MDFFLPIAQVQVNILTILILSFAVGFLSGIFGIGGGFLMTPILIFLGIHVMCYLGGDFRLSILSTFNISPY